MNRISKTYSGQLLVRRGRNLLWTKAFEERRNLSPTVTVRINISHNLEDGVDFFGVGISNKDQGRLWEDKQSIWEVAQNSGI